MQSKKYKEYYNPNSRFVGQIISQEAYAKMRKVVKLDTRIFKYVLVKGDKRYTIPDVEAPQFENIANFSIDLFDKHNQGQETGWQYAKFIQDDSGVYYTTGFQLLFPLSSDLPVSLFKSALPVEFTKNMGKWGMVDMYVNQEKTGLVFLIQILRFEHEAQEACNVSLDFAVYSTYLHVVKECVACKEMLPVTKMCKVCRMPFCSKECMKTAWPTHKAVCNRDSVPAPAASVDSVVKAVSKVSLAEQCPCGGPGSHICTRCRKQWYCSKECQRACWHSHSFACGKKKAGCPRCGADMDAEGAMGALCSACSR
jgi:hypothetical protein